MEKDKLFLRTFEHLQLSPESAQFRELKEVRQSFTYPVIRSSLSGEPSSLPSSPVSSGIPFVDEANGPLLEIQSDISLHVKEALSFVNHNHE